jgi:hypothetical protein
VVSQFDNEVPEVAAGVLVGSLLSGGAFVALGLDLESAAPLLAVVGAIRV